MTELVPQFAETLLPVFTSVVVTAPLGDKLHDAIRLARELGPGHVIVTILCDSGARYASKLFNPSFLRAKNLPVPAWLERRAGVLTQAPAAGPFTRS